MLGARVKKSYLVPEAGNLPDRHAGENVPYQTAGAAPTV